MRKLIIGAYITYITGHHPSSWRRKGVLDYKLQDINLYYSLSKKIEEGLIDFIFLADTPSIFNDDKGSGYGSRTTFFEPITLLSSISSITKNVGLIGTSSTTYKEPYNIAREYASLDHISNGRAGWNLVTSSKSNTAGNFGYYKHLEHKERYIKAKECCEIVKKLWDSYEDDTFIRNIKTGVFYNNKKIYRVNYIGKYLKIFNSLLNISRTPQGHPIIVQAGSSNLGIKLASEIAEIVFTAQSNFLDARKFYKNLKNLLINVRRNFNDILIMPGLSFYIGKTKKEAIEKFNDLQNLIPPSLGINILENLLGDNINISLNDLNKYLPEIPSSNTNKSRKKIIEKISLKEKLTIKELYKKIVVSRGHLNVIGSYDEVSNIMYKWFTNKACDGFNIMPPILPECLIEFIENIIPRLQKLNIYKNKYKDGTLRDKLNIPKPQNIKRNV